MESISTTENNRKLNTFSPRRVQLCLYDVSLLLFVDLFKLVLFPGENAFLHARSLVVHICVSTACVLLMRLLLKVYKQVWRYGGSLGYMHLISADILAGGLYFIIQALLPIEKIEFMSAVSLFTMYLLSAISIRLIYQYLYERVNRNGSSSIWQKKIFSFFSFLPADSEKNHKSNNQKKIKIAIVGAGRVGSLLAEELLNSSRSPYTPSCFIDIDKSKIGRQILGIPVLSGDEITHDLLSEYSVQEIVFAIPQISTERKRELYEFYKQNGYPIKVYDYPVMETTESSKRYVREFDIEELLFRRPVELQDEDTNAYYKDKVVLITGGGGSIGGELCRQVATMNPKQLIILDIYENGAYEIQQELKMSYGDALDVRIEIASVCDVLGLEKVFATYNPDVVLHAAAHKHVPLMENNCCEAVKNNVFGTLNTVKLADKYSAARFIMVSTDKAVNPTNVMGATKRVCEMIVQAYSKKPGTNTVFSSTRFGNVLGSAGSVIPIFKKQILRGGPITITDKRIIRYFMTIPEAAQLVLQSGVIAKNGELFVLDMGEPVRIIDLAESMIRLSGFEPYVDIDIVETGLRKGEKLYEELLIKTEELDKTQNSKIFIERDVPLTMEQIERNLSVLSEAVKTMDDAAAKHALKTIVPTFLDPAEVNGKAV